MNKKAAQKNDESGQATVEFALALVFTMTFTLFYVQLALFFAWGNYIHYATFMAARTYKAGKDAVPSQVADANTYLASMLQRSGSDRLPLVARGDSSYNSPNATVDGAKIGPGEDLGGYSYDSPGLSGQSPDKDYSWMDGVRYRFKANLFAMPMGGALGNSAQSVANGQLKLISESWLGREANYLDCQSYMKSVNGIYDNGC